MNTSPFWLASGHGGTPLVMLHGLGMNAEIWLPQLNHFGRSRLSLAWTQPGIAPSPAPAALSWEGLADSLHSMLDGLGIDKAHLLGHSMGGMVAQEFYHRYPKRVASLILYSSSGAFGSSDPQWKQEFVRQREQTLEPFSDFIQAAPALFDELAGPRITPVLRELAITSARDITKKSYLETLQLLVTFNRKADLGSIAVPTLLIGGELDLQSPVKGIKRMAEQIPNSRFSEIKGVQHMSNLEAPAAFNEIVDDFLRNQT